MPETVNSHKFGMTSRRTICRRTALWLLATFPSRGLHYSCWRWWNTDLGRDWRAV